jgi:hypothetical protein
MNAPSRFLDDISDHLMEKQEQKRENKYVFDFLPKNKKSFLGEKINNSKIKDGDRISHSEFGDGLVVSSTGETFVIAFKKGGLKRLAKEYAKLKKI